MSDKAKVVLVLEDTPSRINWLRERATSYGATVHSTAIVKEFLTLYQMHAKSDVRAIVLDHDLGGYLMPVSFQDPDGLDGIDAVEQMPFINAPVLIWSSNDDESPRMEQLLRGRGFNPVSRQPWYGDRDAIYATLRQWFSRA